MDIKHRISAAQFFVMAFVSRVVVTIALNSRYLGGENMLEGIVSYLLAMLLGLLLAVPIWLLHSKYPQLSVGAAGERLSVGCGKLLNALYILYFIVINGSSLGLFQIFLLDTVNPEFSAAVTMAAVLAAAAYGALRGIETVARCAGCIFAVMLAGTVPVFIIAAGRFDPENLEPLFVRGFSQTLTGVKLFIARTSVFADMAVLLPMVKGKKRMGFFGWAAGTGVFVSVLLLLLAGCLGPYAATQNFPVYALSAITEVRSLQRLDAVFVGVWLTGLIIKLACDLYACRVCAGELFGRRMPRTYVLTAAGAVLAADFLTAEVRTVQAILLDTELLFWFTVVTGAVLPAVVVLAGVKKRSGSR